MLTVVGGTYKEICLSPSWHATFGSGLRAAVAISNICDSTRLITYMTTEEQQRLEPFIEQHQIAVFPKTRKSRIEWQYDYSGGSPRLLTDGPPKELLDGLYCPPRRSDSGTTELDNVLLYGTVESDQPHMIEGRRLVYDPQSGLRSRALQSDRRRVSETAIVLNLTEAKAVALDLGNKRAQKSSPRMLARYILNKHPADVVVVKNGTLGAHVVAISGEEELVPAYIVSKYFGIGTGDVFSAVFAALWGEQRVNPVDAARQSSVAVAHYCSTDGILPLPPDIAGLEKIYPTINMARIKESGALSMRHVKPVYLAGPFFTISEQWLIQTVRDGLLANNVRVWSPLHDAGRIPNDADYEDTAEYVKKDIAAIDRCNVLLAVMEHPDPGTLFEIGYAQAKGKQVVVYLANPKASDLTMMTGTNCHVEQDLSTAIYLATVLSLKLAGE